MTQEQAIEWCRKLNAPYPVKYRQHYIWFDGARWHVAKAWNGEVRTAANQNKKEIPWWEETV